MKFGSMPVADAAGCILAHSLHAGGKRFRKGVRLNSEDCLRLVAAGVASVVVAELSGDDVGEDEAASLLADAMLAGSTGLSRSTAFTGRTNIYSDGPGLVRFNGGAVDALNGINSAITLATLPNLSRVAARSLVATAKIITFAVPSTDLEKALQAAKGIVDHLPVIRKTAGLVITQIDGQPGRLAEKGKASIAARLSRLEIGLCDSQIVRHDPDEVGQAFAASRGSMLLLLTGSATSDPDDVGPEGLRRAGGDVRRFGIPVDPGNLLFHGKLQDKPVIGLPGCARSPALNGADWVLERIACGIDLTDKHLSQLGVGGLLKEIPTRPQPRAGTAATSLRPCVAVILLADGTQNAIFAAIESSQASGADAVRVICPASRKASLERSFPKSVKLSLSAADAVELPDLIAAAASSVPADADAVLLLRPGEPASDSAPIGKMIAAFSPQDGREICRVDSGDGSSGMPILFGRRFFDSFLALCGLPTEEDPLADAREFVCHVR